MKQGGRTLVHLRWKAKEAVIHFEKILLGEVVLGEYPGAKNDRTRKVESPATGRTRGSCIMRVVNIPGKERALAHRY